jgi:hypothetical protein
MSVFGMHSLQENLVIGRETPFLMTIFREKEHVIALWGSSGVLI